MNPSHFLIVCVSALTSLGGPTLAKEVGGQYVRLAELEIDSGQLDSFKAALKEEIQTSVRAEPGVLALYAVCDKDNPAHIMVFEVYRNADAYKSHLETPHFRKFKSTTTQMVRSLKHLEAVPIFLGAKAK